MTTDNATTTDSAIAITVEARAALSDLHSEYLRRMGNLGYHRIVVNGDYYWKKVGDQLGQCETILCPFQ